MAEAEGDDDGYFDDLKNALYAMFPALKTKHDAKAAADKAESIKQFGARKRIAEECMESLNTSQELLPQVRAFFAKNYTNHRLSDHYSDEICMSADIWRYGPASAITKLAAEVRRSLQGDNRQFYLRKPDSDMQFALETILRDDAYGIRVKQSKVRRK